MTRDEAIKMLDLRIWPDSGFGTPSAKWVDSFVALGMLKLEEPKSARERFKSKMISMGYNAQAIIESLIAFDESQK